MSVEYGRRGLVGVLTPQANTTVEPEFSILLPPGFAMINARMVSNAPQMLTRLTDYFDRLGMWTEQFANAPVDVIAVACTGASYLIGAEREKSLVDAVSKTCGKPVVTSGMAVVAALHALHARRVALVSPYPLALTELSVAYWSEFGIEAACVVEVGASEGSFHPIYAMPASDARAALDRLDTALGVDAVVMLGTGMPTLQPILQQPIAAGAPVLSCMLATAWRAVSEITGAAPTRSSLMSWIEHPEWAGRLQAQLGAAVA
jgi:maleate cis-trans isomerase